MYCYTHCLQPCRRLPPSHSSTRDSRTHTGNSVTVSCGVRAPLSWVLVCKKFCLCPPIGYNWLYQLAFSFSVNKIYFWFTQLPTFVAGGVLEFRYSNKHLVVSYWRRQWHPTPVLLPGKSHGWRSLGGLQSMGSLRVRHN